MKLIVGLGNIGSQYHLTRHNVGFMALDTIFKLFNLNSEKKLQFSNFIKTSINDEDVIFAKPNTFVNLSGKAVIELMNFFKISLNDLLIIHDDMDSVIGSYKIKINGSSGGHNGIKNIIELLGNENFIRFKIGIGRPTNNNVINWVLGKFTQQELCSLDLPFKKLFYFINEWTKNNNIKIAISKTNQNKNENH